MATELTDEMIAELERESVRSPQNAADVATRSFLLGRYVPDLLAERKRMKELLEEYVRGYWVKEGHIHTLTHEFCFSADRNPAEIGDNIEAAVNQQISLQKCIENIRLWLCGLPYKLPDPGPGGIFVSSRYRHAPLWRQLRASGMPIISTWIDGGGIEEATDGGQLWERCVDEATQARALVLYREDNEPLKGALVEAGAALGAGVPVYTVGCEDLQDYSWMYHPLVTRCEDLKTALSQAAQRVSASGQFDPMGKAGVTE